MNVPALRKYQLLACLLACSLMIFSGEQNLLAQTKLEQPKFTLKTENCEDTEFAQIRRDLDKFIVEKLTNASQQESINSKIDDLNSALHRLNNDEETQAPKCKQELTSKIKEEIRKLESLKPSQQGNNSSSGGSVPTGKSKVSKVPQSVQATLPTTPKSTEFDWSAAIIIAGGAIILNSLITFVALSYFTPPRSKKRSESKNIPPQKTPEVSGSNLNSSLFEIKREISELQDKMSNNHRDLLEKVETIEKLYTSTQAPQAKSYAAPPSTSRTVSTQYAVPHSTEKFAPTPLEDQLLRQYNTFLKRYDDNAERRSGLDNVFSNQAKLVSVSNIQDVDGGSIPELREMDRAQFYLVQDGNSYFALPIPGMASMRSSYMEAMYMIEGSGSSVASVQKPARFALQGNVVWQLVDKGTMTVG